MTHRRTLALGLGIALAAALVARSVRGGDPGPALSPDGAAKVKATATLAGHRGPVFGIAFSPDGRLLASVSYDRTLRLWYVAAGKEAASLPLPGMGTAVAFSADGRRLATACVDGTITLWAVPGS